jgi:Icc-related predicted phosphoesterase
VKLLAFSDIHRDHRRARRLVALALDVDVVVGAGDFASVHRGLEATIAVLSAIATPTVLVAGNNETDEALRDACSGWEAATVLHGEGIEIAGTRFFGLGGGVPPTPWDWSYDLTEEEAEAKLAGAPEGGVLVVHSPPSGYLDGTRGRHFGSAAILRTIEAKQPRLAVCGHIHECQGEEAAIGPTRVVNLGPEGMLFEL